MGTKSTDTKKEVSAKKSTKSAEEKPVERTEDGREAVIEKPNRKTFEQRTQVQQPYVDEKGEQVNQ